MKSYGTMEGVYINGAPQGITFHETDNFTLYPASIISINKNRFTKHYFIGDKRIASRIGTGLFNNVYGRNGSYVTAGQQDYAERMNQIQKQKEAYYKQQGIAPGVPTMKGAYGDPENTHIGYNSIIRELGNHDVPQGWIQTPRPNTTPNTNPGPPVSWNDPSNPDDPQAGYGYIPNDTTKEETFFYHSDHLGSTSYITDDHANITQYDAYLPYGELLVDEHSSSEDLPYKFNGKQFDNETGLYYYGARYMNPVTSLWYGVDPLAEKFLQICSYNICLSNPIRFIDRTGKAAGDYITGDGTYLGSDGKDDQKLYVLKMSNKENIESYGNAKINGLDNKIRNRIIKEKDISNKENFVEIDGSRRVRNEVVSKIGDNGLGGTSDNNNREYGLSFTRNDPETSVYCKMGDVGDPAKNSTVSVSSGDYPDLVYIHTHPSGTNGNSYWIPGPSAVDVDVASSTRYVISMRDKNVYIYNHTGILSKMQMDVYQNFGQVTRRGLKEVSVTDQ